MSFPALGAPAPLIILALAFLLGSVLGGQILGHLRKLDLRATGSGNLGATNALRAGGKGLAVAVLIIDLGKGMLAVGILPQLLATPPDILPWGCGLAAILGHVYSPWARFHGGKGAATALGAGVLLVPAGALWGVVAFALALISSGFVGLSMVFAHSVLLLHTACFSAHGAWSIPTAYVAVVLVLMIWTHRDNLRRVWRGQELRFERVMLRRPTRPPADRT